MGKEVQLNNLIFVFGALYVTKVSFNLLSNIFQGLKTFVLPLFWPRNFPKEYGSWAVITGCTRGVGLQFAYELAKRGMNLVLIGRDLSKLLSIEERLREANNGIKIEVIDSDLSQIGNFNRVIEDCLSRKDIGILINNVGVILPFPMYFHEIYEDKLKQMINVNIMAATLMTQKVLPKMMTKKKGAIVNMASVSGLSPQPLQTVYAATKAYLDFFSRGLETECRSSGITVQTICPSYICTGMTAFSQDMQKPSFFVPSPEAFAASAIRTLGFSSYTTGYWTHSLQAFFPFAYMPRFMLMLNERFRSAALRSR